MDLSDVTQFETLTAHQALAALIREGAKLRPPCRKAFSSVLTHAYPALVMGSCALGAAFEAKCGELPNEIDDTEVYAKLGIDEATANAIIADNDYGDFSRQQIADRLEQGVYACAA